MYGSLKVNDSVCVIDGRPLALIFYVLNPHTPFTNLIVRWFRSDGETRSSSSTEELTNDQNGYTLFEQRADQAIQGMNCTTGPLYRDQYFLNIDNFTSDKDGHYWCQVVVNNSVSEPPQYVRILAADNSSCTQPVERFVFMGEPECAVFHTNTSSTPVTSSVATPTTATYYTSPPFGTPEMRPTSSNILPHTLVTSLVDICTTAAYSSPLDEMSTTHSNTLPHTSVASAMSTAQSEPGGMDQIAYVAGFLIGFLGILVATLAMLLLLALVYIYKHRRQRQYSKSYYNRS